jgi:3-phenylpropionate/trans-cinnamate dioxygenase ferredoxin reductase subunit
MMGDDIFIIIGAGHAGVRAAKKMRDLGFGGKIIMIAKDGVQHPYERPPLSKWRFENGASFIEMKPIISAEIWAELNIEVINARVTRIDKIGRAIWLENGVCLNYHKLLLATGARARKLSINGADEVHHLRDIKDAKRLYKAAETAKSALILGGGFIGLELAASLVQSGVQVHIVEMSDRLLGRSMSAKIAKIVHDLHEEKGVKFHLSAHLISCAKRDNIYQITLNDGTQLDADILIAGIGSIANTDLADDAGLSVKNGIRVDRFMQTSDLHIFAAGDCCNFPLYGDETNPTRLESWQAAGTHGDITAFNMLCSEDERENCDALIPWFWSEQYDHVLQVVGISCPESIPTERNYSKDHHMTFSSGSDNTLQSACGIAPQTKIAKDIRFAMKLIIAKSPVTIDELSNPNIGIKSFIKT